MQIRTVSRFFKNKGLDNFIRLGYLLIIVGFCVSCYLVGEAIRVWSLDPHRLILYEDIRDNEIAVSFRNTITGDIIGYQEMKDKELSVEAVYDSSVGNIVKTITPKGQSELFIVENTVKKILVRCRGVSQPLVDSVLMLA